MSSVMHRLIRNPLIVAIVLLGGAWWLHAQTASYGPYHVVGFNYTNHGVYNFVVDGFGAGSVHARQFDGGGGTVCCMEVPRNKKTWHLEITYDLTPDEDAKNMSPEIYETDIAVPQLPNKRDGYIEFHFLPDRKIEAQWVEYPTMPRMRAAG
ncbi:DUF3304 domain-containing protein [Burkholderia anthina]|uniref:DUF3304 domain-containing protein n=1 Tax=Burkholderia anthina TaxID=179879 RepID=UPI001AA0A3F3|nr:DUF3304 domain-containing protein [Burkholderia anthina]QTD94271.1 DUF3304 domain-containing protein [Burkholderia anthina]